MSDSVVLYGGPVDGMQCEVSDKKVVDLKVPDDQGRTHVYSRSGCVSDGRAVFKWSPQHD